MGKMARQTLYIPNPDCSDLHYGFTHVKCIKSKESWPKGPGFGLPLKGAVVSNKIKFEVS